MQQSLETNRKGTIEKDMSAEGGNVLGEGNG